MRSLFQKKPLVLLFAILALGALTVLSVSLRGVSFNEAQPFDLQEAESVSRPPQAVFDPSNVEAVKSQIAVLISLTVLLALIGILVSPEARKRMLRLIVQAVVFIWVFNYLLKRYPEVFASLNSIAGQDFSAKQTDMAVSEIIPPSIFTPPKETPLLSYLISVLIVLAVLFIAWKLYRIWRELNPSGAGSLKEIAKVARASLRDISDGRESTDVILNCYFRMSDAVADKKRLRRDLAMTPAEFAHRLEQSGLPGDAVRRLTRLFESVRYGNHKTGPKEINEAVACLTAILQYCGEPA